VIALIDYGAGNLTSVRKALAALGASVVVPREPADLASASGVIVPGVGHFAATTSLDDRWREAILGHVGEGRPLLGICLGMQWLYEGSDESPAIRGLGVFSGRCFRLENAGPIKVPHVGWNTIDVCRPGPIAEGLPRAADMYFTHSFAAPVTRDTIASTEHGARFASIAQRGQIAGVQFHPEKSGDAGLRILRNFITAAQ